MIRLRRGCGGQGFAATMPRTITIYSKPDCHLCDLAKEVVERCRQKVDFTVEVIDISPNPQLLELYRNDIPVILLDGKEIARHVVRERKLLELLQ
jgi:glutaredoxin